MDITKDGWRDRAGVQYGEIIRKRENAHGRRMQRVVLCLT